MPTASTIPFLILFFILWRKTRGNVPSIVVFMSVFGAASVLNVAGSGIAPWLIALVLGITIKLLRSVRKPRFITNCNVTAIRLLLLFVLYAIWTGMVHPFLFHGVPVASPHSQGNIVPLSWGTANLFQLLYLAALVLLYVLALFSTRERLAATLHWYLIGCEVICFFAFYQLASSIFHIPFPSAVLYSNPVYVIYPAYKINGLWRVSSTLTEASAMAFFLSLGVAMQAWRLLAEGFRWRSAVSLAALVSALLLTQSSTGYLCLLFIMASGAVLCTRAILRGHRIDRRLALAFVPVGIAIAVICSMGTISSLVKREIRSVLVDKTSSSSYRDRTASNMYALETAEHTYWLGAGWGSVRCSGIFYLFIGTVGVPGLLLFLCFLFALFLPLRNIHRPRSNRDLYGRALFATVVAIFGLGVSGADPVSPILWVLFGVASAGPETVKRRFIQPAIRSVGLERVPVTAEQQLLSVSDL